MKSFRKITSILCIFALATLPAKAALVTDWDFEIDSGFTSFTGGSVTGSNDNGYWTAPSTLSWGSGADGPSSIDVGGATNGNVSGSLQTDGASVNTVSFTHINNPIAAGAGLTSAMLSDRIFLTPQLPVPGPGFAPPNLVFNILFIETTNAAPCAVAGSPTPCNDIFVLDVEGAGFNPINHTLNQNFGYDGNNYNARLFITGLDVLEDSACAAALAAAGCIGLTTVEGATNTFQVALDITTETFQVPEPGTLAILAIGLLALTRRLN